MPKKVDYTGRRKGILTAIEPINEKYNDSIVWKFQCDCGNTINLAPYIVFHGTQRSCGCLHKQHNTEFCKNDIIDGTKISMLTQKVRKDNKLGVKGVSKTLSGKYQVRLTFKGKFYHGGVHETIEQAIETRKVLEKELFKEYIKKFD